MIQGVLNVYKEKGFTSHDVVAKLRGILGQKKIGHGGTLDPDAEGVLPILLGRATKFSALLTDETKAYEAVLLLGVETDTQDISGRRLREADPSGVSREQVEAVLASFVGTYAQTPPMYSAKKIQGKKLYELAREGKTVPRPARDVQINQLNILQFDPPRVKIFVDCSKGTYVRTLCQDIGQSLGCGGCMEALTRTRVGTLSIRDSVTVGQIESAQRTGDLSKLLIPVDAFFPDARKVTVTGEGLHLVSHGNPLPRAWAPADADPVDAARIRLYDEAGQFLALYGYDSTQDAYRVVKMFSSQEG